MPVTQSPNVALFVDMGSVTRQVCEEANRRLAVVQDHGQQDGIWFGGGRPRRKSCH